MLEAIAVTRQRLRRREHLRERRSGLAGAALDVDDVVGDLLDALRRLLGVAGDFLGCGPCSSTAAAMVEEISDSRSMVPLISLIALTESRVAAWMPVIC